MNAPTRESRRLQPTTPLDPNLFVSPESIEDATTLGALIGSPTPNRGQATWVLTTLLPQAWVTTSDDEEGQEQARKALSLVLHHDLNTARFDDAMFHCGNLFDLDMGGCLELIYGDEAAERDRADWIRYETEMLNEAIGNLTAGIPEQVAA